MLTQKERKIEYKREHFAVLRRKRMDQRDSSADILILRILSGAFAAHGCAPTTHGPMPEPTPGLTPEPVTITVPPATPPPITPAPPTAPPWYVPPTPVPPSEKEKAISRAIERGLSQWGMPYSALDCSKLVRYAYVEYDPVFDNVSGYTSSRQMFAYVRGKTEIKTGLEKWEYTAVEEGTFPIIPDGAIIFYGDGKKIHHVGLAYDGEMLDSATEKQDGTPDGVYFPRDQYVSMITSAGKELYVYGYALPREPKK